MGLCLCGSHPPLYPTLLKTKCLGDECVSLLVSWPIPTFSCNLSKKFQVSLNKQTGINHLEYLFS